MTIKFYHNMKTVNDAIGITEAEYDALDNRAKVYYHKMMDEAKKKKRPVVKYSHIIETLTSIIKNEPADEAGVMVALFCRNIFG